MTNEVLTQENGVYSLRQGASAEMRRLDSCPGGRGELYLLNAGPHEMKTPFGGLEQKGRIRGLTSRIRARRAWTGDLAYPLPEG